MNANMHIHHEFRQRLDQAANALRRFPDRSVAAILNEIARQVPEPELRHETAHHLGLNRLRHGPGRIVDPVNGQPTGLLIAALAPEDAAVLLADRHPGIMAPAHLNMATSLWLLHGYSHEALPDLTARLETESKRVIWQGRPYAPAARWQFPDGSGLVQIGAQIRAGVHEDRQDAIREQCLAAVRKRNRINKDIQAPPPGWTPMAPHPAFIPASDGILSHQAAMPHKAARCWCERHDPEPDRIINAVRP